MNFKHISVLLNETIEGLNIKPDGIYVDGTLGGAGHSLEICKRLSDKGKLIGIDQDINAVSKANEVLKDFKDKIYIVHDNFSNIRSILENLNIKKIDGVVLDLGVSSHQLDEAYRGFSYKYDANLDMRMDIRKNITAHDVVNKYSDKELTKIFLEYGEERWAKRIAEFIVNERNDRPIDTTFQLVEIVKKAIPKKARQDGPHPAKRIFQAIRIEVNNELLILRDSILDFNTVLNTGGRMCVITFHSLEDRIIKKTFKELENPCTCPREFPICICNKKPQLRIITRKPIISIEDELLENHRSRSAKLRIAEKI